MGGSGDYFEAADSVIVMDNYEPSDQTAAAHAIAARHAATLAAAQQQQQQQQQQGHGQSLSTPTQQQPPGAAAAAGGGGGGADDVWVSERVPLRVYASSGQDDARGVKTHVRGLHHIQVRHSAAALGPHG
jgi:hypothetical protein